MKISKIAVIGWGSLIWNPKDLNIIDKNPESWKNDGPELPIEFSRISIDGRLTLVISDEKDIKCVKTLWNYYNGNNLKVAKKDLVKREGCDVDEIGVLSLNQKKYSENNTNLKLKKWLDIIGTQYKIESIVWANLQSNFADKGYTKTIEENIFNYLNTLKDKPDIWEVTKNYILKTPSQIQTQYRSEIEKYLNENS